MGTNKSAQSIGVGTAGQIAWSSPEGGDRLGTSSSEPEVVTICAEGSSSDAVAILFRLFPNEGAGPAVTAAGVNMSMRSSGPFRRLLSVWLS